MADDYLFLEGDTQDKKKRRAIEVGTDANGNAILRPVVTVGDETATSQQADSSVAGDLLERVNALVDALTSGQADDELRTAIQSISSPTSPVHDQKTVSSAGTAEPLVGSSTPLEEGVTVKALDGNSGKVYVGDSPVSASNGFELAAGEQVFVSVADAQNIYVDVDTGGEGVSFIGS